MTAGALLLQNHRAPHLPVLPGPDHGAAMRRLRTCLAEDYRIRVCELAPARIPTPTALRRELSTVVPEMGRLAGLVVVVRGYLTVFDRAGGPTCGLALRDSIRGRPASMVDLRRLVDELVGCLPAGQVLLCVDVDLLATRVGGTSPPPGRAATLAVREIRHTDPDRVSALVTVNGHPGTVDRRAVVPLARAVDSVLRSASAAGRELSSTELVHRVEGYLDTSGATIHGAAAGTPFAFTPRFRPHTLPDYVIDDLYSPDPGSRLDAVTELVELAGTGNALARSQLDDVRATDPSARVRGFAQTLWRRADAAGARQLLDFGLIPGEVWEQANRESPCPT